ncbi:unnamed protein product [Spirodela intermedia]|uniref:Uncharacterized protein n=1 Tax=Spirodela intermedia TaxID=51605 RepID=A0A7I8K7P1_SPIIN|nr:unnamed protein product [Spirodela intermedia]
MGKEEGGVEPAAKFAAVWDAGVVADRRRPPLGGLGAAIGRRGSKLSVKFSNGKTLPKKDYMVGFQEVLLHTDNVNLIMIKTSDVSSRNEMRSSPLPHRCLSE